VQAQATAELEAGRIGREIEDRPALGALIVIWGGDEVGDPSRFIRVDYGVTQAGLELNAAVSQATEDQRVQLVVDDHLWLSMPVGSSEVDVPHQRCLLSGIVQPDT
jgi:hypothetical protein